MPFAFGDLVTVSSTPEEPLPDAAELCIFINSAVQHQATENPKAIKAEYGLQ
jgi:hypothetical protein